MKKWIIPVLGAFILLSCSLPFEISLVTKTPVTSDSNMATSVAATVSQMQTVPTATSLPAVPLATATPELSGVAKDLGGVSFSLPACLAADASGVIVPEENPGADSPDFAVNPEYRKISLVGYPLSDKFFGPIIQVYPLARYEELAPSISDTVAQMQQFLAAKPVEFQNGIPLLPIENAAQIFHAQVNYLDFQNGHGIGFLTQYAQNYAPVDNHDLFYTFQGLTGDGKYWVSIFLPVNASFLQSEYNDTVLPAGGIAAPDMNSANLDSDYQTYYSAIVKKLNSTTMDQFNPTLFCINSMIQSLNVGD
jgi:hypothetical protein